MAKSKGDKNYHGTENTGNHFLFLGIGAGAILLVLAEIFCILAEIYYMLSRTTHMVVILISALLLLGTTGVFLYILKNALAQKLDEQEARYGEMLQISKATYMKMRRLLEQIGEERSDGPEALHELTAGIQEDMARELAKQSEELYKRQMSIANAQVKRNREDLSVLLNSNKRILAAMEEKPEGNSDLDACVARIEELQNSIKELYALCEKIGAEPPGVHIEPLPREVVEDVTRSEIAAAPEPTAAESQDPNRQLTAEEIAALFNNV